MSVNKHVKEHAILGVTPPNGGVIAVTNNLGNNESFYASPMVSEGDTSTEVDLCLIAWIHLPFIMPSAGIVTEIHFIAQGNTGGGVARNFKWAVGNIVGFTDGLAAGFGFGTTLGSGATTVDDDAAGDITVASGLSINVPTQFMVGMKGPFKTTASQKVRAQRGISGGPLTGYPADVEGGTILHSAVTLAGTTSTDTTTPDDQAENVEYGANLDGLPMFFVKWKQN